MKKLILIVYCLLFSLLSSAEGIQFFNGTFNQALETAKKEKKLVFVDFFTTWCGPCKYMSATVFPDEKVGAYFNEHFICLKVDAEKSEPDLVSKSNIVAYPTLGFFTTDGKMLYHMKGGMDSDNFIRLGMQVNDYEGNKIAYSKNKKNIDALTGYVLILQQNDTAAANKIVREHLSSIKIEESIRPENWALILSFEKNYSSRFFQYTTKHFKYCLDSLPGYQDYFTSCTGTLIQEAVNEKDEAKVKLYKDIALNAIDQMGVARPPGFEEEVDIYYYANTGQKEKHLQVLDVWLMTIITDVEVISNNITEIIDRYGEFAFDYCYKWAEKTMNMQKSSYTYLTMAYVYKSVKKKAEALKYAETALQLCTPEDDKEYIEDFINQIKNMP